MAASLAVDSPVVANFVAAAAVAAVTSAVAAISAAVAVTFEAAAAALTSLAIIDDEGLLDNAATVGAYLQKRLRETCSDHPLIGDVRGVGMIAGAELVAEKAKRIPFDPKLTVARKVYNRLLEEGVIARPIQNTVAMAPPLVLKESEVDYAMERLKKALDRTAADLLTDGIWKN